MTNVVSYMDNCILTLDYIDKYEHRYTAVRIERTAVSQYNDDFQVDTIITKPLVSLLEKFSKTSL